MWGCWLCVWADTMLRVGRRNHIRVSDDFHASLFAPHDDRICLRDDGKEDKPAMMLGQVCFWLMLLTQSLAFTPLWTRPTVYTGAILRSGWPQYLTPKDNADEDGDPPNETYVPDDYSLDEEDILWEWKSFWKSRWDAANTLEIRLDATVLACFVLSRFLIHDMSLPPKQVPGFEVQDIIMLLHTFSSAAVLAIFWTMVGLGTGLWQETNDTKNWIALVGTTGLVAPAWLVAEHALGWSMDMTDGWQSIVVGSLGLFTTMSLSRFVPQILR